MQANPTLEDASVRQLLNELCRRSPSIVVALCVPEDGQNHYTISRWTGSAIVAAGMIRAMQLDVDAALSDDQTTEDADAEEDADEE